MTPEDESLRTWSMLVIAAVVAGAAVQWLAPVLIPFVLALLVFMSIRWAVASLVRVGVPRQIAQVLAILIGIVSLVAVAGVIGSSIAQLQANLAVYQTALGDMVAELPWDLPVVDEVLRTLSTRAVQLFSTLTGAVLDVASSALVVFVYVVFLLVGSGESSTGFWGEVEHVVQQYIAGKLVVSAVTGILTGVTLALLGVDLALAFGVVAFLLNFVPYLGPALAIAAPLPLALLSPTVGPLETWLALVIPMLIQGVVGNFVEPRVLGRALDLHPVTVLLTLALGWTLWGVMGMLLATPLASIFRLVLERSQRFHPFARLMEGDPSELMRSDPLA